MTFQPARWHECRRLAVRRKLTESIVALCIAVCLPDLPTSAVESGVTTFGDDGGWCWFQDERALVHNGRLIVGTVAAGIHDPTRKGNIEVVTYDLSNASRHRTVLHNRLQCDDHNSPSLLALGRGRVLAMYSKHGNDNRIYYRRSEQHAGALRWGHEHLFVPSRRSRVTYSNLFALPANDEAPRQLFNFYRGYDDSFKPSWMTSEDDGLTWSARRLWIDNPSEQRHRPYVKYASNARDTIHFVFTEGHPRDFNNSIFHAFYRNGAFHDSGGAKIKEITDGPITPHQATQVFAGDENNVAWTADLHLDSVGQPVVVYSVQKNAAGLGRANPRGGQDHRYRYARWDGARWHDHEIAYAGTRLYAGEDDYTGGICLNPDNPEEVFLSSDVDIVSGRANASGRYEIHKGVTKDFGRSWSWTAITENSDLDNIRPLVPSWNQRETAVLWLRGKYVSYTDFDLDVVGLLPRMPKWRREHD